GDLEPARFPCLQAFDERIEEPMFSAGALGLRHGPFEVGLVVRRERRGPGWSGFHREEAVDGVSCDSETMQGEGRPLRQIPRYFVFETVQVRDREVGSAAP